MRPRQAGFSLIELLVSLALFSIVLSMVFAFLHQTRRNLETEASGIETQHGARVALEELSLLIQQAGFGIDRSDADNAAIWQGAVIYAGPNALAFNADLDESLGPVGSGVTLEFPDGSSYAGEGDDESTHGAETYYYTIDANGDGRISAADRWTSNGDAYNPAAESENPLDYALFRRVYGYDGEAEVRTEDALAPYLFTNATPTDDYADGTSPAPLFSYWLTEDLDGDDVLADAECVIPPCPPNTPRRPRIYLWGDSDFDGSLAEAEKEVLRVLPVGAPGWSGNPLAHNDQLHSTILAADPLPGSAILEVADGARFAPGQHVEIGRPGQAERRVISAVDTSGSPDRLQLASALERLHELGDPVTLSPTALLGALRTVQIRFGAIGPERNYDAGRGEAPPGRAGRIGTRGLDYKVVAFERSVSLPNLRMQPMDTP